MDGVSQHYIPAGFLGRFSADSRGVLRGRKVWTLKPSMPNALQCTAEQIGCEDNLYRLFGVQNSQKPDMVDDVWSGYEKRLSSALDELSRTGQKTISANIWLRILVPFVAGLFVRGKEFGPRYEQRMKGIYKRGAYDDSKLQSDNTNTARLMEFQRLLAPVMSARWVVMHTRGDHPLITNELGFTIFQPPDGSDPGIAIPIGPNTILGIIRTWPKHSRLIMQDRGTGQWRAVIEHVTLTLNDQRNFNEGMANISQGFLAGPTAESVEQHKTALDESRLNPGMVEAFWPRSRILVAHEFEWYRAVTAISKKSSVLSQVALQNIDFTVIAKDWTPVFIVPFNLREFPSGMLLRDDKIGLSMTEIPGFTDDSKNSPYIITPPTEKAGSSN